MIVAAPPALVSTCESPRRPVRPWHVERGGGDYRLRLIVSRAPAVCQAAVAEASPPETPRGSEWQVGAGYAWSIDLLQGTSGRHYVPITVSWGRDVTADGGRGLLRGRLMWGVEVMPIYLQTAPTSTTGAGVAPLVWRWRFVPRRRAAAFAELAFGGLFTADPVPEGTESANFLAHGGFGVRWRPGRRLGVVTAYRFQHISNGNQLATNPGVNAHVAWVGVSIAR
jgi:hypothetical protein